MDDVTNKQDFLEEVKGSSSSHVQMLALLEVLIDIRDILILTHNNAEGQTNAFSRVEIREPRVKKEEKEK